MSRTSASRSPLTWGALFFVLSIGIACAQVHESQRKDSTLQLMGTERLALRAFAPDDWRDVHELAIDWSRAPGPKFDKWPITEEGAKGLTEHFSKDSRYFAICLRQTEKVVGLLALNSIDANKQLDLGHVILSKYQDNDYDREALEAIVDYIFKEKGALSIVAHNASEHAEQVAPLTSLGFRTVYKGTKGENTKEGPMVITKAEWGRSRSN